MRLPVATEHQEQVALCRWCKVASGRWPCLAWLYAIPNAGRRRKGAAGRAVAEGLKAGVPDLVLPAARGRYHGAYIEMKRTRGGKMAPEQVAWRDYLVSAGYAHARADGWDQARAFLEWYCSGAD